MHNFLTLRVSASRISVRALIWAFPFIYAFTLASLPVDKFIDRDNYLALVTSSSIALQAYSSSGLLTLLQNEPVWLSINLVLGLLFENDVALQILIFVSSFLFSFCVLRMGKPEPKFILFAIAICVWPQVMKNYVIHIRQGLAISVFMLAMLSVARTPRLIGLAATPFFHSSFFFVQINLILAWFVKKSMKRSLNARAAVVIAMVAVCVTSIAAVWLVGLSGARQVEEQAGMFLERSGLGFIFWLTMFLIFVSNSQRFQVAHFFSIASILGYILLYFFFSPVARVFESAMPIVLISGYELKRGRFLFFCLFSSFFVFQWLAPIITGGEVFPLALP